MESGGKPPQGRRPDGTPAPLTFRGFRFHPETGRLEAAGGTAAVLRPKTAALLLHLLGRRGAVWPDVTVTEGSITQCVGVIRRAMGEEGRFLRTLPRRGHVLEVREDEEDGGSRHPCRLPRRRLTGTPYRAGPLPTGHGPPWRERDSPRRS